MEMKKPLRQNGARNRRYSNSNSGRKLERIVFILTILTFVIIIILLGYMYFKLKNRPTEKEQPAPEKQIILKPPPEYKAAERFLKMYMDESVNPCDDFWEFACGKTPQNGELMTEVFNNQSQKFAANILLGSSPLSNSKIFSTVGKFYSSCLAVTEKPSENIPNPDLEIVRKIGGIPALGIRESCQRLFEDCYKNYLETVRGTFFVDFVVMQNTAKSTDSWIRLRVNYLEGQHLNFSPNETVKLIFQALDKYRENLQDQKFRTKLTSQDRNHLLSLINQIKKDEKQICGNYTKVDLRDLDFTRNRQLRTFVELIIKNGTGKEMKNVYSQINFQSRDVRESIRKIYGNRDALQNLLVGIYLVRHFFNKEIFIFRKSTEAVSPADHCRVETAKYFGWAVLKMLMEGYNVTEGKLAKIRRIVFNIREKFGEMLLNSPILDHDSRVSALKKLRKMTTKLVSPLFLRKQQTFLDFYKDFDHSNLRGPASHVYNTIKVRANQFLWKKSWQVLHNEDNMKFRDVVLQGWTYVGVNAYHNRWENEIFLFLSILVEPFFGLSFPPEIQYGLFGLIAGHELGHGFDPNIIQYDFSGQIREWLSEDSKSKYSRNTECIKNQLPKGLSANCVAFS